MRCQPQSRASGWNSHLPSLAPPQGPLSRLLVQAVRGQMPPVHSSMHSPHSRQRSLPCHSPREPPREMVLQPGWTTLSTEAAVACTPTPQHIASRESAAVTCPSKGIRPSFTWALSQRKSSTVEPVTAFPAASRRLVFRALTTGSGLLLHPSPDDVRQLPPQDRRQLQPPVHLGRLNCDDDRLPRRGSHALHHPQ